MFISLYLVNETFTNAYFNNILDIISFLAIFCGVFVITSKNPVISVLFLIGLFGNISGYLILIGLTFMGLAYLVVYIGAISILFLFILMLINIRVSELQSNTLNTIPLAIVISFALNYPLLNLLPNDGGVASSPGGLGILTSNSYINKYDYNYLNNVNMTRAASRGDSLSFVTSSTWDGNLSEASHITSLGSIMYTNYNLWLLLAGLILLLAMVGCIVIVIKQPSGANGINNTDKGGSGESVGKF